MIRMAATITAIVACVFMFAVPASAQGSTAPTWQDTANAHHQQIYQMMKDMTEEMSRMTEQMGDAKLGPAQRVQLARRMARMSVMMRRLSGLAARPALKEPEWQRRMGQMRRQMDEMTRDSRMGPQR
jgi:hypothetical protein